MSPVHNSETVKRLKEQNHVFDIGLHNGDDAEYFLHCGYRVIGVEANPLLAAQCEERFAEAIRQGQMVVVNAGILREPGVFTFYRNLFDSGWSSFEPEKGKKGGQWEEMEISCITTQQLISKHGTPHFMKVDIEGADLQALHTLNPSNAPPYVSLELSYADPIVERLIELGYSDFKFVDGESYWPSAPIFDHETGWRFLRKAGRLLPPVKRAISSLPHRFRPKAEWNPPGKHSPDGYPFTLYSSGPFGEKAAGPWIRAEEAVRWFSDLKNNYRREGKENSLWWDVHARHSSAAPAHSR
jgi:FkbM family methyltransferase